MLKAIQKLNFDNKERRIYLSADPDLRANFKPELRNGSKQWYIYDKPFGLWYGFNDSWIRWIASEGWEIKFSKSTILGSSW